MTASAATLQLDAMSKNLLNRSNFTIIFDDLDSDSLFSMNELVSFSGVTILGVESVTLVNAPTITGFTDPSAPATGWRFGAPTIGRPAGQWTYAISLAVVPLPASAALLFGAIGALGLVRRRRAAVSRSVAAV
jgi:hypothetical protein